MLRIKEAVLVCGQGTDGKSLYLSLNFAVNSKTALKEKDNINNKVSKKKGKRKKKGKN